MKKTLFAIIAACALGTTNSHGQGSIFFQNLASGPIRAVNYIGPNYYAGAPFRVSLFWVAGAYSGSAYQLISSGTYFAANAPMFGAGPVVEPDQSNGAGFFDGGVIQIPGTTAGIYSFVVVAWNGASSYQQAFTSPSSYLGNSSVFQVTLVTGATPANTTVIPTFLTTTPDPEPTTFALAGLGLVSLLVVRRRAGIRSSRRPLV